MTSTLTIMDRHWISGALYTY